jgi:hypothetical protein
MQLKHSAGGMRRAAMIRSLRVATVGAVLAPLCAPASLMANEIGKSVESHVCASPGWSGTLLEPRVAVVHGAASCYAPQVTSSVGNHTHHQRGFLQPSQNGTPCTESATSEVELGPLHGTSRTIAYYDPNTDATATQTVPDDPSDAGYIPATYTENLQSLWNASAQTGSNVAYVPWQRQGAYAGSRCTGGRWVPSAGERCPKSQSTGCYPIPTLVTRDPLPFTPPPPSALSSLVQRAKANFQQTYDGGHVVSQWASGGYIPQDGEVVRNPVCFWVQGSNVPADQRFSMVVPQPGSGPVLVVNYVVSAVTDDVWWDYGDGTSEELAGASPETQCVAEHTYYHISADAYGSNHRHTPPPGVVWPFGDREPERDMQAVAVWRHMHLAVTAYYQQTNGDDVAVPIPVANQADFWLASQPEWVVVFQIEPWVQMCPPCSTPSPGMN